MTNILNFKPRAESRAGQRRPETPADIIIFPGVRYERIGCDQASASRREGATLSTALVPVLLRG
ncbi:hypothetical protein [Tianweitania sp.]|uniref:hypothetical protein n=1 Tax=Tianweitania sp. TaxID=2021634 RepID=UPI00289BB349|nr:hypothetical protein [Tianweitania sp.]